MPSYTLSTTGAETDAILSRAGKNPATGWRDMLAPLIAAGIPVTNAPSSVDFGPEHTPQREALSFAVGDYCFVQGFHVNHDMKPGGAAYIHVHWSTDGTDTNTVKWEFTVMRALGHNQENFGVPTAITVEQAAAGTAWRHMVAEVDAADALTLIEPDELILVTLRRVTNGATDNGDTVFGLFCDLHYETDREATINKAPDFYA